MSNAKTGPSGAVVTVEDQLNTQRAYIAREFGQFAASDHSTTNVLSGEGLPEGVTPFYRAGP